MRPQVGLRNESRCLAIDCQNRAWTYLSVDREGERLSFTTWQLSAKLGMTSFLGDYDKTEAVQHAENLAGRQTPKLG